MCIRIEGISKVNLKWLFDKELLSEVISEMRSVLGRKWIVVLIMDIIGLNWEWEGIGRFDDWWEE